MIQAGFERAGGVFRSVRVSGHAGFADAGKDIVCAAVTSAFQLTANGITEILAAEALVDIGEDTAAISLSDTPSEASTAFLAALHLHFVLLCEQYPKHIEIFISEV